MRKRCDSHVPQEQLTKFLASFPGVGTEELTEPAPGGTSTATAPLGERIPAAFPRVDRAAALARGAYPASPG